MTGQRSSDAVDFGEAVEPRAWKLRGVGAYGSDVDVVSREEYRELVTLYQQTVIACQSWAERALAAERALEKAGDR